MSAGVRRWTLSRSVTLLAMLCLGLAATPLAFLISELKLRQLVAAGVLFFLLAAIWMRARLRLSLWLCAFDLL